MKKRIWLLGAADPEMEEIELEILAYTGEDVVHACDAAGVRVHPGNAYRAVLPPDWVGPIMRDEVDFVEVECHHPDARIPAYRIDHHRPGDPGYGRPPAEFLSASSIGQVFLALRGAQHFDLDKYGQWWAATPASEDEDPRYPVWIAAVPTEVVLIAAADHCLGAAYLGGCPGVDPDELMRWRAESRARFQGRTVEEVVADIEAAKERIRSAPVLPLHNCSVRDLRMTGDATLPDARGAAIPELPEAALRIGEAYLAGPLNTPDGRLKIVCSGREEHVRAFLEEWAPNNGVVDTYGDPLRGFAGGYLA